MVKQKSNHFIVQHLAPIKGFHLVRAKQQCITVLFHRKKKERTITKM